MDIYTWAYVSHACKLAAVRLTQAGLSWVVLLQFIAALSTGARVALLHVSHHLPEAKNWPHTIESTLRGQVQSKGMEK